MAGTDDKYIWQLPDTTGLKHEVIAGWRPERVRQRYSADRAKLVLTYSPEELANAVMRTPR